MFRHDAFDNLRQALRVREEGGYLLIPPEMTEVRFKDIAQTKLTVLLRKLGHVLRQSGVPATVHINLSPSHAYAAVVLDQASQRGVFFYPDDLRHMRVLMRLGASAEEAQIRLLYQECTTRFLERVIEDATRHVLLQPPI